MRQWIKPFELSGKYINLKPLTIGYCSDLITAVEDGNLWHLWFTSIPHPDGMAEEIERRLNLQKNYEMVPFVILDANTGLAIGMTTYCRLDPKNLRLEIGYTWYRKSYQKTPANTECKLMLLDYAFQQLGCAAVEFRTNAFNFNSRRAIERLGARLDGILRSARIMPNGVICDSYVYSILSCEWPAVKANLQYKLSYYHNN